MGLSSGTVTFLFTKITNGTLLWEKYPQFMGDVLRRHDDLARNSIQTHRGTLFQKGATGDGLYALFPQALDALEAACTLHLAFVTELWPMRESLRVAMALHTGNVELHEGAYSGATFSHCACLRDAAPGGHIYLSQTTWREVRSGLLPGAVLRDLGRITVEGLEKSEHVWELLYPATPKT